MATKCEKSKLQISTLCLIGVAFLNHPWLKLKKSTKMSRYKTLNKIGHFFPKNKIFEKCLNKKYFQPPLYLEPAGLLLFLANRVYLSRPITCHYCSQANFSIDMKLKFKMVHI